MDDGFETFNASNIREIVHKTDGTVELDNCKTPSRIEMIHNVAEESLGSFSNSKDTIDEF